MIDVFNSYKMMNEDGNCAIQRQINETTDKLNEYRKQREPLQQKGEPTIEMKDNENKLYQRRADKTRKENEVKGYRSQILQINQQNNRFELFADPQMKYKRITVQQIRTELQRYSNKFHRVPIGPLGEYIKMVPHRDQNILNHHIQIVQAVLKQTLFSFLVDTPTIWSYSRKSCDTDSNMFLLDAMELYQQSIPN